MPPCNDSVYVALSSNATTNAEGGLVLREAFDSRGGALGMAEKTEV
jgi:hypothetical protein